MHTNLLRHLRAIAQEIKMADTNKAVADFLAVVPTLSHAQLVLIQHQLLVESTRRLYTTG